MFGWRVRYSQLHFVATGINLTWGVSPGVLVAVFKGALLLGLAQKTS
jgi:hypothetical protein